MLLKVNLQTNLKSMYKCDRCGARMTTRERHTLFHQTFTKSSKKYCDLCEKCFRALDRGIFKKREETKNAKD